MAQTSRRSVAGTRTGTNDVHARLTALENTVEAHARELVVQLQRIAQLQADIDTIRGGLGPPESPPTPGSETRHKDRSHPGNPRQLSFTVCSMARTSRSSPVPAQPDTLVNCQARPHHVAPECERHPPLARLVVVARGDHGRRVRGPARRRAAGRHFRTRRPTAPCVAQTWPSQAPPPGTNAGRSGYAHRASPPAGTTPRARRPAGPTGRPNDRAG